MHETLQPHVPELIEGLVRSAMDATPALLQVIIDGLILLLPVSSLDAIPFICRTLAYFDWLFLTVIANVLGRSNCRCCT